MLGIVHVLYRLHSFNTVLVARCKECAYACAYSFTLPTHTCLPIDVIVMGVGESKEDRREREELEHKKDDDAAVVKPVSMSNNETKITMPTSILPLTATVDEVRHRHITFPLDGLEGDASIVETPEMGRGSDRISLDDLRALKMHETEVYVNPRSEILNFFKARNRDVSIVRFENVAWAILTVEQLTHFVEVRFQEATLLAYRVKLKELGMDVDEFDKGQHHVSDMYNVHVEQSKFIDALDIPSLMTAIYENQCTYQTAANIQLQTLHDLERRWRNYNSELHEEEEVEVVEAEGAHSGIVHPESDIFRDYSNDTAAVNGNGIDASSSRLGLDASQTASTGVTTATTATTPNSVNSTNHTAITTPLAREITR